MTQSKLQYVFVGAFREQGKDGSIGGQMLDCRTLMESPLSDYVIWRPLDSTLESLPLPGIGRRLFLAARRLAIFVTLMLQRRVDGVLILITDGLAFVEKGLMAWLARRCRKRVILGPRSGLIVDDLQRSRLMRWYIPFILRQCDHVICQSPSWKATFEAILGTTSDRFVVVNNWIDAAPYAALPEPAVGTSVMVVFMGWVEPNKGVMDLVEAVNRFRGNLQDVKFVVCGRGSSLDTMQRRIADLDLTPRFEFRGWVSGEAKFEVIRHADLFVLPSYREGVPNTLVEAMAAGRPVLSTRVGGTPELVQDGESGRLVDAGDIEALGEALVELCHDSALRRRLGVQARQYILAQHDIGRIWPTFLDLFRGTYHLNTMAD